MEALYLRHDEYIRLVPIDFVRNIMYRIDWDNRLICIKGPKGVGKSTLLQQRIKLNYEQGDRHVLYCSADTGYFATHTLIETADTFVKYGGTHLFIDEIHKYEGWSSELKEIYDLYRNLHIVVSGSSLLQLNDGKADLSRRMIEYEMSGMSFREFVNYETKQHFETINLEDLLLRPAQFCSAVNEVIRPLEYFQKYLRTGYYPFYFENTVNYYLIIENVVNYIIEVELPRLRKVEIGNTRKIKALLQIISQLVPYEVDISKISASIGVQRTTTLNYFKYLEEANLLSRLFSNLDTVTDLQKPDKLFLDNSNLLYALSANSPNIGTIRECFFCNQLRNSGRKVEYGGIKNGDFRVDGKYIIEVGIGIDNKQNGFIAADEIDTPLFHKIPLWAFGFLY